MRDLVCFTLLVIGFLSLVESLSSQVQWELLTSTPCILSWRTFTYLILFFSTFSSGECNFRFVLYENRHYMAEWTQKCFGKLSLLLENCTMNSHLILPMHIHFKNTEILCFIFRECLIFKQKRKLDILSNIVSLSATCLNFIFIVRNFSK